MSKNALNLFVQFAVSAGQSTSRASSSCVWHDDRNRGRGGTGRYACSHPSDGCLSQTHRTIYIPITTATSVRSELVSGSMTIWSHTMQPKDLAVGHRKRLVFGISLVRYIAITVRLRTVLPSYTTRKMESMRVFGIARRWIWKPSSFGIVRSVTGSFVAQSLVTVNWPYLLGPIVR